MRRLWIALTMLLLLFCVTLGNSFYLNKYSRELNQLLTEAETLASKGNWDAAAEKTEAAMDHWFSHEAYLHMVLQHQDTDEILLSFQEVRQLIVYQEDGGEYSAANAQLMTQIRLLSEMEQLNLKNLL